MTTRHPYDSREYWKKMAETRQTIITKAHRKLERLQTEYDDIENELRLYVSRKKPVYTSQTPPQERPSKQ